MIFHAEAFYHNSYELNIPCTNLMFFLKSHFFSLKEFAEFSQSYIQSFMWELHLEKKKAMQELRYVQKYP